ncbi:MAG: [Clostridia bacterium]|nr:[FeFe] hydrogenase H-cluster maturation GTPase HydF [Clostridia bacterium]
MSLNTATSSERVHIGFFGCTNAGKSSLVNAVTSQETALVSEVSGTTTDVVRKAMELLPIGPVLIIDTPGFDDKSILGEKRIENTKKALQSIDAAVLVCDATKGMTDTDRNLEKLFKEKKIPFIVVFNKSDLVKEREDGSFYTSAITGEGVEEIKEKIAKLLPEKSNKMQIVDSIVKKGDFVIMVTPIDEAAPKGRIILPQQNVLRNLLDIGASAIVIQPEELKDTLENLKKIPSVVITDSQVFGEVSKIVPKDIPLTSFSILFAKYKGILNEAVKAVAKIESLRDFDKILIAE